MNSKRVVIIGGGIVGLAAAYKLGERSPGARIVVLEKEDGVGHHQTGHNSGVLHCGLYYKPGSAKARLAVSGIRQMVAFCQENGVAHEVCGKLVVAADASELQRLDALQERGLANGLEGLRRLDPEEMREIEPHAGGVLDRLSLGSRRCEHLRSAGLDLIEIIEQERHLRRETITGGRDGDDRRRRAGRKPHAT